jgi:hypothetical protein
MLDSAWLNLQLNNNKERRNIMRTFKCTLILGLILFSITNVALPQEERATLFPGQSIKVLGITVTWNVSSASPAPEAEQAGNYGTLDIIGPQSSMKNLKTENLKIYPKEGINLYIDEVYMNITGAFQDDKLPSLSIRALKQSQKRTITAAPQNFAVYVSHLCPIFLNEWKLNVSGEKKTFPDGSEYYILTVENPETGTRETIPLSEGANRKVGRYDVSIGDVYELTKTARLRVSSDIDESIRGRDAYVESFTYDKDYPQGCTNEEFFGILSKRFDFNVEWVEYPGYPESIEYVKNQTYRQLYAFSGCTVNYIIEQVTKAQNLGAEWETPTHLRLWYKDYDKVLAQKEREEKRKEENKNIEEEFKKDYPTETRVYYFKTISSKTAKSLIDPELDTYSLVQYTAGARRDEYQIVKGEAPAHSRVLAKSSEQSVADEKTNALILTAIPKTHEKFQKILDKIDAVLEKAEKPEAVKPFLLSATLLQGVRSVRKSITSALHVGGELKLGDLRLRLVRVNENNANDALDDSVELVVNTATSSQDVTIEKLHSQFIDDYEISVPEIKPSGKPEEALATITIRYAPPQEAGKLRAEATLPPGLEELKPQEDVADLAKQFGLSREDMEFLGIQGVEKIGQGVVHLVPERGEAGIAMVSLSPDYSCTLEFQDVRAPYLIVRGSLRSKGEETPLMENTIYLEPGKPALLGITNLREALILLVQLHE